MNGEFKPLKKYQRFGTYYIYQIKQMKDKSIWIGAMGNVLRAKFEKDDLVMTDSILYGQSVRCITEDTLNHVLWMASENGLIKYYSLTHEYRFITTKEGLVNNYLYAVIMDEKGNLWLSSNKGLICYHPKTGLIENYDESDGLQSNEFNTGSFFRSHTGEIFFGGIKGFNSFFPSSIKPNTKVPDIVLTGMKIFNEPFNCNALKELSLKYFENTVSFDFKALEYTNPRKNEYEYMLVGQDENWVHSGVKHDARYSALKPGKYILKVKACNNDHVWSEEKTLLTLTILAPWWERWWFISIISFVFALMVTNGVKFFFERKIREQQRIIEQQKAVEEERARISKDMHDDIGSGLSNIAIMSELLKNKIINDAELIKNVNRISNTAGDLVDSMSQIVWAMNPQNDTLENLMAYIREFSLDYFDGFDINCIIDFPDEIKHVRLSQQERRNIFLIVKETLNNTLKYAEAANVFIKFKYLEDSCMIEICDDGKGFDTSTTHRFGNGLINMKKRMEDIGGKYIIHSKIAEGTKTEIWLNL